MAKDGEFGARLAAFTDMEAASFTYQHGPVVSLSGHRCSGGLVLALATRQGKLLGPAILPDAMVEELILLLRQQRFLPPESKQSR